MGLGPAPDHEIRARADKAALLLFLLTPEVEPTFISDYSSLADFASDVEQAKRDYRRHFQLELTDEQVVMPLWRLLDELGDRIG